MKLTGIYNPFLVVSAASARAISAALRPVPACNTATSATPFANATNTGECQHLDCIFLCSFPIAIEPNA